MPRFREPIFLKKNNPTVLAFAFQFVKPVTQRASLVHHNSRHPLEKQKERLKGQKKENFFFSRFAAKQKQNQKESWQKSNAQASAHSLEQEMAKETQAATHPQKQSQPNHLKHQSDHDDDDMNTILTLVL